MLSTAAICFSSVIIIKNMIRFKRLVTRYIFYRSTFLFIFLKMYFILFAVHLKWLKTYLYIKYWGISVENHRRWIKKHRDRKALNDVASPLRSYLVYNSSELKLTVINCKYNTIRIHKTYLRAIDNDLEISVRYNTSRYSLYSMAILPRLSLN